MCVLALGVVPMVGCSDATGDDGSGGMAGSGGSGGSAGSVGSGACDEDDDFCFPCTEEGIRAAITSGCAPVAGPLGPELVVSRFACDGPQTVFTEEEIVIDNCVILDGEGRLTVDGNGDHRVFSVAEDALAELRGLTVTGGFLDGDADCDNRGSGIHNRGTLFIVDTTLFGNRSADGGSGAISNSGGQLALINSTVSGNDGGIHICDGEVNVSSSTIIADARAIWPEDLLSGVFADNSLIVGECSETELPVVFSLGHNIESPGNTCGLERETDQPNVSAEDLKLGPLADNGGGTKTHALLPGSVAIDVTASEICEFGDDEVLTEDQRGVARPKGLGCDVGAFESGQSGIKSGLWLGGNPASNTDGTPFDTGWAICFYVNVDGTFLIPSTDCDVDEDDDDAYMLELSWKNDVGAGTVQGEVGVCNANPAEDSESIGIGDSSGLIGTVEGLAYVPIENDSFVIYPEVPGTTGYEIPGAFNGDTASGAASWVWSPGMGFSQCELDGGWTATPAP
jgi:hypothetical protein